MKYLPTANNFSIIVFVCNVAYIIQRELDLRSHPELNFEALAKDGFFGPGLVRAKAPPPKRATNGTEHILRIRLNIKRGSDIIIEDAFDWDISNPDNSPDEFAAQLV